MFVLAGPVSVVVVGAMADHKRVETPECLGVVSTHGLSRVHIEIGVVHTQQQVSVVTRQEEGVAVEGGHPLLAANLGHGSVIRTTDVITNECVAVRSCPITGAAGAGCSGPVDDTGAGAILVARAMVAARCVDTPWACSTAVSVPVPWVALAGAISDLVPMLAPCAAILHPGDVLKLKQANYKQIISLSAYCLKAVLKSVVVIWKQRLVETAAEKTLTSIFKV